jgi:NADH:ubiquinone oxidoreductase subunit 6 (subunit J)
VLAHFFINFILIIFHKIASKNFISLVKQFSILNLIIFLSIPSFCKTKDWHNSVIYEHLNKFDSLLAIKDVLYHENALYLFIPFIVLLIALIGAAVFSKRNKNGY